MKTILKTLLLLLAMSMLPACNADDTRAVTMVGYNYTDRPIGIFSVNGVGGSNVFVNGGGASFSCCVDVTVGKPAKIEWVYHRTEKQYNADIPIADHAATVIVPTPEAPGADHLEVHFYPDNHVELALVKFPGKRRLPKIPEDN